MHPYNYLKPRGHDSTWQTAHRQFDVSSIRHVNSATTPARKAHECSVCGRYFPHQSQLRRHTRVHTGDKPFRCALCGISFSRKDNLYFHRRSHEGHPVYQCHLCDKAFDTVSALRIHAPYHHATH